MIFLELFWPAILAAMVVGAAAPAIGTFVVQKRLSLIGDGIGHIAFAGVAVGLWLGVSPFAAALVAAIAGALGIDRLRRRAPEEADMALALFFYGAIAAAVFVASISGSYNVNLFGFLFGQVLTVSPGELAAMAGLATALLLAVLLLYRGLFAIAIDEEAALVAGVPVGALNVLLMLLAAATIGIGMQVVGILLVAALMVLPVGVARNLVRSFQASIAVASATGAASAGVGLVVASIANSAPSGTIVLVAAAAFVLSDLFRRGRLARARRVVREAA